MAKLSKCVYKGLIVFFILFFPTFLYAEDENYIERSSIVPCIIFNGDVKLGIVINVDLIDNKKNLHMIPLINILSEDSNKLKGFRDFFFGKNSYEIEKENKQKYLSILSLYNNNLKNIDNIFQEDIISIHK